MATRARRELWITFHSWSCGGWALPKRSPTTGIFAPPDLKTCFERSFWKAVAADVSPLKLNREFKRNEPTHVGCYGENARASLYFFNTRAEVDRFVEGVKEIQKCFGH